MRLASDLLDLRYRGGAHVESWFFGASDPAGRRALWIKGTVLARGGGVKGVPPVAEAWAITFDREKGHVATKTTVPLEGARFAHGALDVEIDGCALSLGRTRGALATGWRRVAWDLAIGPELAAPIVHLPARVLYRPGRPPSQKLVTPLADARASGTVLVHRGVGVEERWDIDGWPCMIGHNWGRRHAHLYAWSHCNTWDSPDADGLVFEGVSARMRLGPVLSPMATALFVRFRGQCWDLRSLENRGLVSLRRWEASAERRGVRVTCELSAETDDLVGLHYANPKGDPTYCLATRLARARIELSLPGREKLVATSRAAALEIGTHDAVHGVRMYL